MNPLLTVKGAISTAIALAIVVSIALSGGVAFDHANLMRTLHIVAGVCWIGLLYYFNLVQMPALAAAAADAGGPGGAGINKYVAPRALLWFRYAALVTWVSGAYYIVAGSAGGYGGMVSLHKVFTFADGFQTMGAGAWLGTIMLFNVWHFIWPNQKKVLGLVAATDDEKAKARKVAMLASRTNFVLSVPMLLCMGAAKHGLPF
jgi:uncharacterized membrane protein